jgi:hypothetical protein
MLLRDNLQPTDFADAICRVTQWMPFDGHNGETGYRIWICRCTHHWFQRHEWSKAGANQTEVQDWIYVGYSPRRQFDAHLIPSPDMRDI